MNRLLRIVCALTTLAFPIMLNQSHAQSADPVRNVQYEFRGLWVATVNNLDWPSRPGLSSEQQIAELTSIIDRAAKLNFNAIVLQVRTECDAFYMSSHEPWSHFLTANMGTSPNPLYDPLALAVDLCHKRGMELHAWINPYRAGNPNTKGKYSAQHVSRTKPEIVRNIGDFLWLDPSEPGAQEHILTVIRDLVTRYDLDGIHYDDYFYPYRSYYKGGSTEFPDNAQWQKYKAGGGQLSRDDWRRDHVNRLVERIYSEVKVAKPWVKVGISPFGIWRPGYPSDVTGMDQYQELYADARLWINKGWLDYWTPQLYWKTDAPKQKYSSLLNWWVEQNNSRRHVWPGLIPGNIQEKAWDGSEIISQVQLTRANRGSTGNVHFRAKQVLNHGPTRAVFEKIYADPALVPPSPWLSQAAPQKPMVSLDRSENPAMTVTWSAGAGQTPFRWALFAKYGDAWSVRTIPAGQTRLRLTAGGPSMPGAVGVAAVDRAGNLSATEVVDLDQ